MSKLLPANRVVLILHYVFIVATAAAILIAAVSGSLPHSWQANVAVAVSIATAIAGGTVAVTKFLDGAQKSEALTANARPLWTATSTTGMTIAPTDSAPSTGPAVDAVLAEISAAEAAAATTQSKPGSPAEQVSAGLAPSPPPVVVASAPPAPTPPAPA